jgi:hypothetical protein
VYLPYQTNSEVAHSIYKEHVGIEFDISIDAKQIKQYHAPQGLQEFNPHNLF